MQTYLVPRGDADEVSTFVGTFEQGMTALQAHGLDLILLRELAQLRQCVDVRHPVNTQGVWLGESYAYLPDGEVLVLSRAHNPLLQEPGRATQLHKKQREVYLNVRDTARLRQRASADPDEATRSGVLLLPRKGILAEYPTTSLTEEPLMRFLFGDQAKPYSVFLQDNSILSLPHEVVGRDYTRSQERAFARPLWSDGFFLHFRCRLYASERDLHDEGGRVYGVRYVPTREPLDRLR